MSQKLINDPANIIQEMIAGMCAAWPDLLRVEGETGRAIVAVTGPRHGKVGIVIGGGSGHEPAFAGYVGKGLADAAAVGNVFASPSPKQIADAARAADGGAGVVMLFGNYTGDVMNFDMARESLEKQGIPCQCFAVTDDVASAPPENASNRRGIAGDFFIFKIAGAAADSGQNLDGVMAAAAKANAATRSMGVALSACSMPQTAVPNFEVPDGQMEVGMGLHGEPGVQRLPLETADAVADRLLQPLLAELDLEKGGRVAALVNGLGATAQLELYILWRRIAAQLAARGITVAQRWVGEYATSLEMAGASLTLMRLDDTLEALLAWPCHTPALVVGSPSASHDTRPAGRENPAHVTRQAIASSPIQQPAHSQIKDLARGGAITPEIMRQMIAAAAHRMQIKAMELSKLDGAIGDGDHGITMATGWEAAQKAVQHLPLETPPQQICAKAAEALLEAVGASSGPLWSTALETAGDRVAESMDLDAPRLVKWLAGMRDGMAKRGGANRGEKTMMDAWEPAITAAETALASSDDATVILRAAADAAKHGAETTRTMVANHGRAAKLGQRAVGHLDPGAVSTAEILDAMADAIPQKVNR